MAGNFFAYMISVRLRRIPIYDALLLQDGISLKRLPAYRGEQDWRNLPVSTIMSHDCHTVIARYNAEENLKVIEQGGHTHHGYPVVTGHGTSALVGMVMHHELDEFVAESNKESLQDILAEQQLIVIHPDDSIRNAANTLVIKDVLQAPVVSRKDPTRLLGIVTLHDIARQQNAIEESIERE